ncbi:MAG: homocysteine S-methyltransferase family protein [Comamonadaceae bacterium]|nr:homocysteine S-methyltransferase family protein [Comamonadaceae bacterium]
MHELNLAARAAGARGRATSRRPRTRTGRASSPACSGPPTAPPRISPDVNDPGFRNVTLRRAGRRPTPRRRAACVEGGADLLLVETIFDTLNAKAALFAIDAVLRRASGVRLPVMISGTITDASGRTLSGQTAEAFWNSLRHARPLAVGLNCALGAEGAAPVRRGARRASPTATSRAHPNAGLPNAFGELRRDAGDDGRADRASAARAGLVNIVGGCCGTTPGAHRAPSPRRCAACRRAPCRRSSRKLRLSGLEPLNIGADALFVNVGERTNVTGSRSLRAPDPRRPTTPTALAVARQQVENGAQVIDVNMDEGDARLARRRWIAFLQPRSPPSPTSRACR